MGWTIGKRSRERRLVQREEFRNVRRVVSEDVTAFGEQLAELHFETLAPELTEEMRDRYQRALDLYERASVALQQADTATAARAVEPVLNEGRFSLACVLACRDGNDLPQRQDPCFFNSQHGPAATDVVWAPRGGVERLIAVCGTDARRLELGEAPDIRLVLVGDRYVKWYEADQQRGLLVAARAGAPKYVMLQADISAMGSHIRGGGL